MKPRERVSRSTYRAILYVQKDRDDPTGLFVSDRYFVPEQPARPRRVLWLCLDLLLLTNLLLGLMLLLTTGFSVPVGGWFYPGLLLICCAVTLIFRSRFCARHWAPVTFVLLLAYLMVLYLNQEVFLRGMNQFVRFLSYTVRSRYSPEETVPYPAFDSAVQLFLLLCSLPAAAWLAVSLLIGSRFVMACLLIFPLLVFLALCGAAGNTVGLFLILFGMLQGIAFSRPKKQKRMWGGSNGQLLANNRLRFESIQKKTAAAVLLLAILLSVPGFLVVRPLLAVGLKPAGQLSAQVQSGFLNRLMQLLPELSAGQWELNLEAVGGGVQAGSLDAGEGYLLERVEDLRLTVDRKPTQPLFLKGYVGKQYDSGSWSAGAGTTFDGAAMNWKTDGSPRIYIQNLPFLRTAFAAAAGEQDEAFRSALSDTVLEPAQLWVERLNANDSYTYVPYGAYLNEYYQVDSGDCAVLGQSENEDRFYFFSREDTETILTAWNQLGEQSNLLDRVEESYRAFCQTDCMSVPNGLDELRQQIRGVMLEYKWKSTENQQEITAWIRRYLAENYTYQLIPPEMPQGEDSLRWFLTESKTGNSVHFASAAVVLYRMFGIPARYVVGYEIPAQLFTPQSNGVFTATVQGENSQAWAEIYVPGIGWMPRDMTPGIIGTFEEVGPGGEKIEAVIPEEQESTVPSEEAPAVLQTEPEPGYQKPDGRNLTVAQVVTVIAVCTAGILTAVGVFLLLRSLSRAMGWRVLGYRSGQSRLLGIFQAFCRRMRRLGLPEELDSQSGEFAAYCVKLLEQRDPQAAAAFPVALQELYACCFGVGTISETGIIRMRRLLLAAWKRPRG